MKRPVFTFALILFACLQGQGLIAAQNCSNRDFHGIYGIRSRGAVTVPGFPITGPMAEAGQVEGDGNGNAVFNTTVSFNGILFTKTVDATFTVSPDCQVQFTVQPFAPIFQTETIRGVLSDNSRQVDFMITEPLGQAFRGLMKKQDVRACNATDFSGEYVLHLAGSVLTGGPGEPTGEFVRVGTLTSDGRGNFSAETNANYNGLLIRAENFSGTYTVASNCTVNVQYAYGDVPYSWSGAVVQRGQEVELVVAHAGLAIAGELKKR